jgi:hypothetical protein
MADPKRVGVEPPETPTDHPLLRSQPCSGAKVRITREQWYALAREHVEWASKASDIPIDGRGDARVRCTNEAMSRLGVARSIVWYGLCASCHGMEERNRMMLRIAQGKEGR